MFCGSGCAEGSKAGASAMCSEMSSAARTGFTSSDVDFCDNMGDEITACEIVSILSNLPKVEVFFWFLELSFLRNSSELMAVVLIGPVCSKDERLWR